MKKIFAFLLTLTLVFSAGITAFAEESEEAHDASNPRLMVTGFSTDKDSITPSDSAVLKIKIKNFSKTKAVSNIKLSIFDETREIETDGMPTKFVNKINADATYTWEVTIKATQTAQIGRHNLAVSMEYEDQYFTSYSANDIISVDVRQSVGLDYSNAQLPVKVYQDGTETTTVTLMNTGKTDIRNCKIDYDIKGLSCGGTVFVGEIPAGESKDGVANLRVSNEILGDTAGKMKITYEDVFGEVYSVTAEIATKIVEKPIPKDVEEKEEAKYPLWWVFLLVGLAVGGGVGAGIPIAIHSSKARKEDELRL